jgi:hypothetical protein
MSTEGQEVIDEVFKCYEDNSGGLKFTREKQSNGGLQYLDVWFENTNGLCWYNKNKGNKPLAPFDSHISGIVKTATAEKH